jgi:hypothetical protein
MTATAAIFAQGTIIIRISIYYMVCKIVRIFVKEVIVVIVVLYCL